MLKLKSIFRTNKWFTNINNKCHLFKNSLLLDSLSSKSFSILNYDNDKLNYEINDQDYDRDFNTGKEKNTGYAKKTYSQNKIEERRTEKYFASFQDLVDEAPKEDLDNSQLAITHTSYLLDKNFKSKFDKI